MPGSLPQSPQGVPVGESRVESQKSPQDATNLLQPHPSVSGGKATESPTAATPNEAQQGAKTEVQITPGAVGGVCQHLLQSSPTAVVEPLMRALEASARQRIDELHDLCVFGSTESMKLAERLQERVMGKAEQAEPDEEPGTTFCYELPTETEGIARLVAFSRPNDAPPCPRVRTRSLSLDSTNSGGDGERPSLLSQERTSVLSQERVSQSSSEPSPVSQGPSGERITSRSRRWSLKRNKQSEDAPAKADEQPKPAGLQLEEPFRLEQLLEKAGARPPSPRELPPLTHLRLGARCPSQPALRPKTARAPRAAKSARGSMRRRRRSSDGGPRVEEAQLLLAEMLTPCAGSMGSCSASQPHLPEWSETMTPSTSSSSGSSRWQGAGKEPCAETPSTNDGTPSPTPFRVPSFGDPDFLDLPRSSELADAVQRDSALRALNGSMPWFPAIALQSPTKKALQRAVDEDRQEERFGWRQAGTARGAPARPDRPEAVESQDDIHTS